MAEQKLLDLKTHILAPATDTAKHRTRGLRNTPGHSLSRFQPDADGNTKSMTNEQLVRGETLSRRSARFLSRHKIVDRRSNEQREHHCNQQPTDNRNG